MRAVIIASVLLLVPVVDLATKGLLERYLGSGRISLGTLGAVKLVKAPLWLTRPGFQPSAGVLWTLWLVAALMLLVGSLWLPASSGFVGLLLGGSLSHGLEYSRRGHVRDYVCLRFWPAFNLADVAITLGSVGLLWQVALRVIHGTVP